MKAKLQESLMEAGKEQLFDIIYALCEKDPKLEGEIDYVLNPKKLNYTQPYYNRLVKAAIDTNSWSIFPNKGVLGLRKCLEKALFLDSIGNRPESIKIAYAISEVIKRCKRNYNRQNTQELDEIRRDIAKYL